ncbi:MAG: 3-oxoacyl-[acyl-carrier-protein] reductase [Lachnospiraceae bacterium]|nr:3-oxoacyl-[acyl-carrier-protein] reductase [Lachnospiraceae bacterium]
METAKIALVTGAGRGIGAACARKLAAMGHPVIINYNGSKAAAEEVAAQIAADGGKAVTMQCNVSDPEAVAAMVEAVQKEYGCIDILVNNAGITRDELMLRMKPEDFDAVVRTNMTAVFYVMQACIRGMIKKRKGKIVNISSVSGVMGNAGQINYSAAKAGVIGMTKTAARELAGRNITVNAVAPGFITTDMTNALPDAAKEGILSKVPMGRGGRPEDVANAVAFLCSEESDYITGQVLCVDGGMAM